MNYIWMKMTRFLLERSSRIVENSVTKQDRNFVKMQIDFVLFSRPYIPIVALIKSNLFVTAISCFLEIPLWTFKRR